MDSVKVDMYHPLLQLKLVKDLEKGQTNDFIKNKSF